MAERRMISKKIISSARFLKMPHEVQNLYFYLILNADDDGVSEGFNIMRMLGTSEDSLKILVAKGFVIVLNDDLVSYITDWTEHNKIRADRKIDSMYRGLLLQVVPDTDLLEPKPRSDRHGTSQGQPRDGIGKDRLGEVRLGKVSRSLSNFEKFIFEIEKLFEENKILTFKSKINKKAETKKAFKDIQNIEDCKMKFVSYVKRHKNKASKLDKFLLAYQEGNLNDIEYGDNSFKGKQPQVGSLEWERQQMLKQQEETINAEITH